VPPSAARDTRLFVRILWGIGAGALLGVFIGEAATSLDIVASGFIRLLQVNVLPYLLGSLIASLGSRGATEMRLIARYGITLLLLAWALALIVVVLCPLALPHYAGSAVFGIEETPPPFDWLDLYIPANLFHALANNLIPAVVLFGILAGLALGQMSGPRKTVLLQALEAFNEAMARVSRMILRLTPFGLFAIAAVTAGAIRVDDLVRLQVWLSFYVGATLLMSLWVLPSLVARFTPVPFVRFLTAMRSPIVTAAAAGDVLVVLPLIAESAKELLVEGGAEASSADDAISVSVPLLYNFPHVGKILSLAFLPFGAWFSGTMLDVRQLFLLVTAGPLSLFGSINGAMPFLLDLLHLPADLFGLFSVSSVVNSRFGSMAAAAHTAALAVLLGSAMLGLSRLSLARLARPVGIAGVILAVFLGGTRAFFTWVLPPQIAGLESLAPFELRPPVAAIRAATPALPPTEPGNRLKDIRARGALRVGYFPDAVPWAFVNTKGELVGHDIEAAHRLASQLSVALEFVQIDRAPPGPSRHLAEGRVDILMTGVTATVSRAERMELSRPYSSEHIGFLVHDFDRTRFATLQGLNGGEGLVIAIPQVEGLPEFLASSLPKAKARSFTNLDDAIGDSSITATLTTMERAYYLSRVHPEFAAVRPEGLAMATVIVYAVPDGELEFKNLVDLWIETRRVNGEIDEAYDYWIRGKALVSRTPRWSVMGSLLKRAGY
jgi:Na+/H+-dicarboxylate symporter